MERSILPRCQRQSNLLQRLDGAEKTAHFVAVQPYQYRKPATGRILGWLPRWFTTRAVFCLSIARKVRAKVAIPRLADLAIVSGAQVRWADWGGRAAGQGLCNAVSCRRT